MTSQKPLSSARPLPLAPVFISSFNVSSLPPSPQVRSSLHTICSYLVMAGHAPWTGSEQEPPRSSLPVTVSRGVLMLQISGMLFYLAYHPPSPNLSSRLARLDVTRNRRMLSHMPHHGLKTSPATQRRELNLRLPNSKDMMLCAQCCAAGSTQPRLAVLEMSSASCLTKNHPTLKTAVLYTTRTSQPWNPINPRF